VHTVGVPAEHAPDWQVSPLVHALLSVHVTPSAAAGFEQKPVPVSQTPARWHWSLGEQTVGVPAVQAPAWQESPFVHALLSVHATPSAAAGFEQKPVPGLQVPATWH
jgi:hypothetical protein